MHPVPDCNLFQSFASASDWHLSTLTWQHRPTLVGDSHYALRQIVDHCLQWHLPLLAEGDLFDKDRPDSGSVRAMCTEMDRMAAVGLPVLFTQGQHEFAATPWMNVHPWPTHVHRQSFPLGGSLAYGLDWTPREKIPEEFSRIPDNIEFFLCHQLWEEHMGSLTHPECSVHTMPKTPRYILSGDYHKHQSERHQTAQGGPSWLVSSGAISRRNLGESPECAFWWFSRDQATGDWRHQSQTLLSRPWYDVAIGSDEQLESFREVVQKGEQLARTVGVPEPLCVAGIQIYFPPTYAGGYGKIQKALEGRHLWIEESQAPQFEVIRETTVAVPRAEDATLASCLDSILPVESEIRGDILSLLEDHRPPVKCIEELVSRWEATDAATVAEAEKLVPAPVT